MKFLLLLLMAVFSQAALFGQKTLISLSDQGNYKLDARLETDTLDIPLIVDGSVNFGNVGLDNSGITYVRLDGHYKDSYKEAFSVMKGSGVNPSIRIAADLRKLTDAGVYQLLLTFTAEGVGGGGAKGKTLCPLSLSIVRPAAKLDTVNAIRVFLDGSEVRCNPFAVAETGQLSRIQRLTLSPAIVPGYADQDIISFSPPMDAVKAGGFAKIDYRFHGEYSHQLPYGMTTGKVLIIAPEMAAPLIVPIEIFKTRWKGWIIVVLFGGILLGAFVRHFLKNKQALEAARLKGYDLIDQIKKEMAKVGDAIFKQKMDAAITALEASLEENPLPLGSDPEKMIADQIAETSDAYAAQKKILDEKVRVVGDNLQALSGCFEGTVLSPVIRKNLEPADSNYQAAKTALAAIDPSNATARLLETIAKINAFLVAYLNHANTQVVNLQQDNFLPGFVNAGIKKQVQGNMNLVTTKLAQVQPASREAMVVATGIGLVDEVQSNLEKTLDYAVEIVADLVGSVDKGDGSDTMLKLQSAFAAWKAVVEKAGDYPFAPVDLTYVRALETAWTNAQTGGVAVRAVRGGLPAAAGAGGGGTALPWESKSFPFGGSLLAIWGTGMGSVDGNYKRTMRNWLLYSAVQVIILSLLLCLGAYKIYAPTFVGTWEELITIFFFGFGLDITTDSVLQLKKS
jgi:hypothetical protein